MYPTKQDFLRQLKKKEIQGIPEILAFNFMMALVPVLTIFFQILAFLSIETDLLDEIAHQHLPAELYQFIVTFLSTAVLSFHPNPLLIAVTLLTLALTISKGVNGIFKAFLITYDTASPLPLYKIRLRAILTFLLLLGFGALAAAFLAFSHRLFGLLPDALKHLFDFVIVSMVCFVFFFLLFKLAPHTSKKTTDILPGCLFTTAGFMLTTTLFTFYVNRLANFHLIYGTLTVIIVLLMWLYLLGWVIHLGIQINYVLIQKNPMSKGHENP